MFASYGESKLANILHMRQLGLLMMVQALEKSESQPSITTYAVHPVGVSFSMFCRRYEAYLQGMIATALGTRRSSPKDSWVTGLIKRGEYYGSQVAQQYS